MTNELPAQLEAALRSFETGALDRVIERRRPEDFRALRWLLSRDASVKPEHRQRAIYALGRWGDASVVPEIVALLPELEESRRITAIEALGRLGTRTARDAVEEYADDRSPQVRKFVVEALGRIGDAAAETRLQQMAEQDPAAWVRDLAVRKIERRKSNPAKKR
jgi:HEAT repeat protein